MDDFPHAWAKLAWEEGHRPLHLTSVKQLDAKERGKKRREEGESVNRLRDLAADGYSMAEAARAIGVCNSTVAHLARRHGIAFVRGHRSRART